MKDRNTKNGVVTENERRRGKNKGGEGGNRSREYKMRRKGEKQDGELEVGIEGKGNGRR